MSLDDLVVSTEKIDTVYVTKLQGNLNNFTSEKCIKSVLNSLKHGSVILDLEELNMVTTQGIIAFKTLSEEAFLHKHKIILINLPLSVRQAFLMAGVRNLFPIANNEEAAFKMASRPSR
ncbi:MULTISPECIES: STAS domain-containing protein [Leptospira]|uniref:STAS domain-containing protein n=5 Tax=Leptospira TaxID=171 RepID=A0AAW5VI33_9LEPT|nr:MULTISPECIES: STAS domain-containing protein [Leptospira]MCT8332527.1 STAS domain-containing protein [Leptospira sp. 85282-16]MCW7459466.1 STAS domain-containing protein [Leptospira bandrabouensis]MCW7471076.1 STAS domain-containing protein [Leptospira kanakyensis]MCW7477867.1 STAS domain-containing protein [Leptospira bandrabouensis]MCW7481811.1 STAS domain-containing protein [Leptospira kanakyensis]